MKNMILLFTILFSFASQSETIPEMTCRQSGGEVKTLVVNSAQIANLDFCFFGFAGMEIVTFAQSRYADWGGPEANRAYRATPQQDLSACARHGGRQFFAKELNGFQQDFCYFSDRSAINFKTLESGMSSAWNRDLNRALAIY